MAAGDTLVNASSSFSSTGGNNTVVGSTSGSSYVNTEASNIILGAGIAGTANESNILRIGSGTGTSGTQIDKAYICGITGINVTGSAVFVSSSNQLGVLLSSRKYKNQVSNMDNFSEDILHLRPVTFVYKEDEDENLQCGLIAEEVAEVMPHLVIYDEKDEPQSVKYNELSVLLLNELQKVVKRLEKLEGK